MANVNVNMLKEKLYPTASALFCIGEVCVDVSKQHISYERAIDKIREYLKKASFYSKYSVDKLIEECLEDDLFDFDSITPFFQD